MHDVRAPRMTEIIRSFTQPIHALEIGTWFGKGSLQIWLKELPEGSTLTIMDLWRPFANDGSDCIQIEGHDNIAYQAFSSTIEEVKKFEQENKRNIKINIIRADSNPFLSYLNSEMFDFIYIDGDHSYKGCLYDMSQAKRLIKKTGIICGDDYDSPLDIANIEELRKHIHNPKAPYHPGLSVAIYEVFKEVNYDSGFWWIHVRDGNLSFT